MNNKILALAILALGGSAFGAATVPLRAASAPEPETYLFDVLRHPQYKGALKQVLKGKTVPDWVQAFMDRGDGVVTPMKMVDIAGHSYRLDHLCKPHDCAGNALAVLWAPGGRKVWAALVEAGAPPVFFGNPSPDQTETLSAAAKV